MTVAPDWEPLSDDELTAMALAADPDTPVAPGAVPFRSTLPAGVPTGFPTGLPESYLPAASRATRPGGPVRTVVVAVIVAAFLIITAAGFCVTYGQLVHA